MSYTDNKVKVIVVESKCPKYKVGDVIRFKGSDLDKEKEVGLSWRNRLFKWQFVKREGKICSSLGIFWLE